MIFFMSLDIFYTSAAMFCSFAYWFSAKILFVSNVLFNARGDYFR